MGITKEHLQTRPLAELTAYDLDSKLPALTGAELSDVAEIWQSLTAENPFADLATSFVGFRSWMQHLGRGNLLLFAPHSGSETIALLPVKLWSRAVAGVRFRCFSSPGDFFWRVGYPIIGWDAGRAIGSLLDLLRRRRDWDLLELGPMLSDSVHVASLLSVGESLGLKPEICRRELDPVVEISGTWEQYEKSRSANLRREMRRGERRLSALGQLTLEIYRGGPDLEAQFDEFCRLEACGWKGKEGSALACDARTRSFFLDLARAAAREGTFRLYFVRLDGRAIACQYAIVHGRTVYALKMGRDESLADYWVGHVLHKLILEHLFETREADLFDMLMDPSAHSAYKSRWATRNREYVWLRFFHGATIRGRLAHALLRLKRKLSGPARRSETAHDS